MPPALGALTTALRRHLFRRRLNSRSLFATGSSITGASHGSLNRQLRHGRFHHGLFHHGLFRRHIDHGLFHHGSFNNRLLGRRFNHDRLIRDRSLNRQLRHGLFKGRRLDHLGRCRFIEHRSSLDNGFDGDGGFHHRLGNRRFDDGQLSGRHIEHGSFDYRLDHGCFRSGFNHRLGGRSGHVSGRRLNRSNFDRSSFEGRRLGSRLFRGRSRFSGCRRGVRRGSADILKQRFEPESS